MRTLLSIAGLLVLSGCVVVVPNGDTQAYSTFDSGGVQGNEQIKHELRPVGNLGGLEVSGPIRVEVRVGGAPSLDIEADSNLLEKIRSETSGDTLKLWVEGGIRSRNGVRATYTVTRLSELTVNGSGRVIVNELDGDALTVTSAGSAPIQLAGRLKQFDVRLNGSGSVNAAALTSNSVNASLRGSGRLMLGQIRGEKLNAELHGSGSISAGGAVRNLNVQLHGSGSAQFDGLRSEVADLATYGSGSIATAVTQKLVAQNVGSGAITVRGNPQQRSVTGRRITVTE
ncbi:GIN domain-containing protein [Janthinobacterium fluminis]|uniref:DUF2807 domain-containing protein n=1 Tax=Janthinobacterium fluminis TaxID=2987524 RepID=A0ABT5JZD0_9BURK|nr:DUF2807 domain-containing protein [Janthinobacterium fluminis]MDC8758093.1 DUF2807 domain-containing protein [Janthinobacterium fluminis]